MAMSGACKQTRSALRLIGVMMLGLGIMPSSAAAQSSSSTTIHGTVKDETGAAMPGVTVTIQSPSLQVGQMTAVSSADGSYRFVDLPAGTYRAKFELQGFKLFVREDLRLTVGFLRRGRSGRRIRW